MRGRAMWQGDCRRTDECDDLQRVDVATTTRAGVLPIHRNSGGGSNPAGGKDDDSSGTNTRKPAAAARARPVPTPSSTSRSSGGMPTL